MKRIPHTTRRTTSPTDDGIDSFNSKPNWVGEDDPNCDSKDSFQYSHGLTTQEASILLQNFGPNELPEKIVPKWYIFVSLLWEPMPIMIWIAIIIEAILCKWMDTSILLAIQLANASIAFYETTQSGNAVAALKASLRPEAMVMRDWKWRSIDASLIVPGDLVLLATGSAVPADCRINAGTIELDQSALTGESLPVSRMKGDSCLMGSTVSRGEVEATVEFTGINTYFGKTAALLQAENEPSNLQSMLMDIMIVLVVLSVTLCAVVYFHLAHITSVVEALSFTVVLIVASIPLAIEIVTTTTLAIGSKELSIHGAIVTRLSAIEDMAGMSILCSDKTGTLTLNKMQLEERETLVYSKGENTYSLLRYAAMASKWKEPPKDALDTLTLSSVDLPSLDCCEQLDFLPFDPVVKKTESLIRETRTRGPSTPLDSNSNLSLSPSSTPTSCLFRTCKGAPHVVLHLVDDPELSERVDRDVKALGERGVRCLAVAKTLDEFLPATTSSTLPHPNLNLPYPNQQHSSITFPSISPSQSDLSISAPSPSLSPSPSPKWQLLGLLAFLDPPRPDTLQTLRDAKRYGVEVKMITGDHVLIARETARRLEMQGSGGGIMNAEGLPSLDPETKKKPEDLSLRYGELILNSNGFAQVFPEHKYLIVECLRELGYKVGMTGDGVNDAPALKRADVGIAVQGATDAARAAADIVLTQPGLSTIIHGILIARCIFVRIRNFITYRIAATMQLLFFFFIAIFAFKPSDYEPEDQDDHFWPSFFHMPVIMLMLITLLNDGTLIAIGYDNVVPQNTPEVWNLRVLFLIGFVMAAVACASSLLLLYLSLDSWSENSVYQWLGLGGISYGQITTSIFLKVAVSDFLTLFSARAGEDWFWASRPAPILLVAGALALTCSTLTACYWPSSRPDGIPTIGLEKRTPHILPLYIWLYCIFWWFVQDAAKVWTFKVIKRFNLFGYNDTGMTPAMQRIKELEQAFYPRLDTPLSVASLAEGLGVCPPPRSPTGVVSHGPLSPTIPSVSPPVTYSSIEGREGGIEGGTGIEGGIGGASIASLHSNLHPQTHITFPTLPSLPTFSLAQIPDQPPPTSASDPTNPASLSHSTLSSPHSSSYPSYQLHHHLGSHLNAFPYPSPAPANSTFSSSAYLHNHPHPTSSTPSSLIPPSNNSVSLPPPPSPLPSPIPVSIPVSFPPSSTSSSSSASSFSFSSSTSLSQSAGTMYGRTSTIATPSSPLPYPPSSLSTPSLPSTLPPLPPPPPSSVFLNLGGMMGMGGGGVSQASIKKGD